MKGIVSDSNNFLWHESEGINNNNNKKKEEKNPKFQLIQIVRLQVVHDYVHWHCSIACCVKLSLVDETLWKLLLFHTEMISA